MDGWMDGWMDGRTDGRTDGRMDGWMDGWVFCCFGVPRYIILLCSLVFSMDFVFSLSV